MPKNYMLNGEVVKAFQVEDPHGPNRNPDLYAWLGAVASETLRTVETQWDRLAIDNSWQLTIRFSDGTILMVGVNQFVALDSNGNWLAVDEEQFDSAGEETTDTLGWRESDMVTLDAPDSGGFGFSAALIHLKDGARVARVRWNERGIWAMLIHGGEAGNPHQAFYELDMAHYGAADQVTHLLPWIGIKTKTGGFVPWAPNQEDVLAEDWTIVV